MANPPLWAILSSICTYIFTRRPALYRAPRGTADTLPEEQRYWRYVEAKAEALGRRFGYGRLDTPVFEQSDLFTRGVGEGTDIVEKEMYIFQDRGGDSMALRPEGTAPVCRAYLEHGMRNLPQPVRLYYFCPVFRYERPQAGRFRQHHQFGVEALGDPDPSIDAEIIEMAWQLTQDLGLTDLSLLVNSIGDPQCRPIYLEELKSYYAGRIDGMCQDCKSRLERNPLRLLDCKQEACMGMAGKRLPSMVDHLCPECRDHWQELLKYLQRIGLAPREWSTGWCAAWTTTPAPYSRYSPRRRAARAPSVAEAATTASLRRWAARPRPASALGPAGSVWCSTSSGRASSCRTTTLFTP